jgi:hypothetical protein
MTNEAGFDNRRDALYNGPVNAVGWKDRALTKAACGASGTGRLGRVLAEGCEWLV